MSTVDRYIYIANSENITKVDLVELQLKFTKKLAGNNSRVRQKEIQKIRNWLSVRSSNGFTDEFVSNLWKGLYGCMWMADKPRIQENLAVNLASLLHGFDKKDVSIQFFGAFLKFVGREWIRTVPQRTDMMFVRCVTRQCFVILNNTKWDNKLIEQLNSYIIDYIVDTYHHRSSAGFLMKFTEIFLEEIAKVSLGKIEKSTVALLVEPFAACNAIQPHAIKHIFDALLYQSDLGREYNDKYEAGRRMRLPGMDVIIPEIPFDPEEIIKVLKRFNYVPYTNVEGTRTMSELIERYSTFATGQFPLIGVPNVDEKKRKKAIAYTEVQPKKRKVSRQDNLKQKKKTFVNSWVVTDLTTDEIAIGPTIGRFTVNDDWDAALQESEYEHFMPTIKIEQKLTEAEVNILTSPNTPPLIISTPATAEKKVTIMLHLNRSQGANEYRKQLRSSPQIPYDSSKKPGKGILKPNAVCGPINPDFKF